MEKRTLFLVTGAAGYLGSNICRQLVEKGEQVRAFVLKNDPSEKYIPAGVEIVEGNLCNMEDCRALFDVDRSNWEPVCIHCASIVAFNADYSQKLIDVNVGGTKNMIACALESGTRMVYVSSTGAIPELPKGQKIKEVDSFVPYDDSKVVGWYSRSKAMASQEVMNAVKAGLDACIVHPSGILGPNDMAVSETTRTLIKIIKGEMPVGIGGKFNLADVRDLAAGCISAALNGRKGECYILGNEEITFKRMVQILDSQLHCGGCKFYIPLWVGRIAGFFQEKAAKLNGSKPVLTSFNLYNLGRNNSFDYSKAIRELGYRTRPYEETLKDEAEWLKAEGLV